MYEASARNLRTAERFLIEPPLSGHFGSAVVSVCDISSKGARFRHGHPVEMGHKSTLRLAVEGRPAPVQIEAVVVWTQVDGASSGRFVSGVRTYGTPELMDGMLRQLEATKRTERIEEMRSSDRFFISPSLDAKWGDEPVKIEDLAARGVRVDSAHLLPVGSTSVLRFAVPETAVTIECAAKVAWSTVKSFDPNRFRAGLAMTEKPELIRLAIGQLCESGRASIDTRSLALKLRVIRARARQLAPSFRTIEGRAGVPAEQYLLIQCVREELRLNPEEAIHWYRRARLLISDPATRKSAPSIASHPDALAVWEYLERSIDPTVISRTFELPTEH